MIVHTADASGSTTRVANGSFIVWGGQISQIARMKSYIPTDAATATCPADEIKFTDLPRIGYNQSRGTIVLEARHDYTPPSARFEHLMSIYIAGSNSNSHRFVKRHTNAAIRVQVQSNGVDQTAGLLDDTTIPAGIIRQAYTFEQNSFNMSVNGNAVLSDTAGDLPLGTLNRIALGQLGDTTGDMNEVDRCTFRSLTILPYVVPAATLPAVSTRV
jgi:hypothetical protein